LPDIPASIKISIKREIAMFALEDRLRLTIGTGNVSIICTLSAFVKKNLLRKEDGIPLPAKAGSFLPCDL